MCFILALIRIMGHNLNALNTQQNNFFSMDVSIFASASPCLTTLGGNGAQSVRLGPAKGDHQ